MKIPVWHQSNTFLTVTVTKNLTTTVSKRSGKQYAEKTFCLEDHPALLHNNDSRPLILAYSLQTLWRISGYITLVV